MKLSGWIRYLPGQEKGNVPYVVNNGAGIFTRSPKETAQIVTEWFSPKLDELRKMSENALKLENPDAVFQVVRDIHELAKQRSPYFIFQWLVVKIIVDLELVVKLFSQDYGRNLLPHCFFF
ncbi:unnamed protein product [Trifolium pratense]|uniref:Uncharacterized protein n=1 Tax=Trifolium pratense TaxID=57577 RepID=A0ACB0LXZ5_TRIPR|nr:unnamed protein product [Trifolium pratense]